MGVRLERQADWKWVSRLRPNNACDADRKPSLRVRGDTCRRIVNPKCPDKRNVQAVLPSTTGYATSCQIQTKSLRRRNRHDVRAHQPWLSFEPNMTPCSLQKAVDEKEAQGCTPSPQVTFGQSVRLTEPPLVPQKVDIFQNRFEWARHDRHWRVSLLTARCWTAGVAVSLAPQPPVGCKRSYGCDQLKRWRSEGV
jgi:hypothetical protein